MKKQLEVLRGCSEKKQQKIKAKDQLKLQKSQLEGMQKTQAKLLGEIQALQSKCDSQKEIDRQYKSHFQSQL